MNVRDRRVHVEYDREAREHVVVMTLDADEAENVADALGWRDAAHRELYDAAQEARNADDSTGEEQR